MTTPTKQVAPTVNNKAFTCCFCLHVKVGTLIYGIISVVAHLILLGLFILIAIHPDVLQRNEPQVNDGIFGKPIQNEDDYFNRLIGAQQHEDRWTKDKLCVLVAGTLAWIMSVLALIYGVARNQASYLMPCFCLQVLDFCLTCLGIVSSYSFSSDVHDQIRRWQMDYPILKGMDSDLVMLFVVAMLILMLSIKAYIMGMVYSCYRYIQLYVAARSVVREFRVDPDSEMLLPPCYEDAIKIPSDIPQPPAYTAASS